MSNLQDLLNLAKADGGKFFVIDEKGDAKLVILSIGDYEKLLLGKVQKQIVDIENINKEILKAQLHEPAIVPAVEVPKPVVPKVEIKPQRIVVDMREEVIDPSFDFEGPKIEIDDL